MTIDQMHDLPRWSICKIQFDEDPQLETGALLRIGRRNSLFAGIDEDSGGFFGWVPAENIDSVIGGLNPVNPTETQRGAITGHLQDVEASLAKVKMLL